MFCKNCGKDIDIKSKSCPYCGEETNFLSGVDGEKTPEHIKEFEEELNDIRNKQPESEDNSDGDEYEDISSYRTEKTKEDKNIKNNVSDHLVTDSDKFENKKDGNEPADEKGIKIWRILMILCIVVIVISLIIIAIVSSKKNSPTTNIATPDTAAASSTVGNTVTNTTGDKNKKETTGSSVNGTTKPSSTTQPTTVGATKKSIEEYIAEAVPNDPTAVSNAQSLYADMEAACAGGDFNKFKTFFNSTYSDSEIKSIFDQYQSVCAGYSSFVVGYTHTVSCEEYTYVYIAATTNLETQEYVENKFVLSADGKLDQSDGGKAWLAQASNIV